MTRRLAVLLAAGLLLAACEADAGRDDVAPPSTTTTTSATGGSLEVSVAGDGFFIVRRAGDMLFTPTGVLTLEGGKVATLGGLPLEGWPADADGNVRTNGPIGDITLPVRSAGSEPSTDATFTIDRTGVITHRLADGQNRMLGQVSVATFATPVALERLNGSLHQTTAGSGLASVGSAGLAGRGTVAVAAAPAG